MNKKYKRAIGTWYECKVVFLDAEGKTQNRKCVVNAACFADAEMKVLERIERHESGDGFEVRSMVITSYTEVYFCKECDCFKWYKVTFQEVDGTKITVLLNADSAMDAGAAVESFFFKDGECPLKKIEDAKVSHMFADLELFDWFLDEAPTE